MRSRPARHGRRASPAARRPRRAAASRRSSAGERCCARATIATSSAAGGLSARHVSSAGQHRARGLADDRHRPPVDDGRLGEVELGAALEHPRLDARRAAEGEHGVVVARVGGARVQEQRDAAELPRARPPRPRRADGRGAAARPGARGAPRGPRARRARAGSARARRRSRRRPRRRGSPPVAMTRALTSSSGQLGARSPRAASAPSRSPRSCRSRASTLPCSPAAKPLTPRHRSSVALSRAGARSSRYRPASVSVTSRVVRRSSSTPSSRSSRRTWRLSAGWATCRRSAARVKLRSVATATK